MARPGSTPGSWRCSRKGSHAAHQIARMARQEQRHLDRFDALMAERRVRPTALQPVWNVAGFALGAATALISEEAAMACTDAVETEIDRHYRPSSTSSATATPSWPPTSPSFAPRSWSIATRRARLARPSARLSAADRGDPRRMPPGDRPVEADLRNLRAA